MSRTGSPIYGLAFVEVANSLPTPAAGTCSSLRWVPPSTTWPRALSESAAWKAGKPSDVVVDGYEGTHLTFTLPAYDPQDCTDGLFGLFGLFKETGPLGEATGRHPNVGAMGSEQHNEVWILDVDGTRLVILAATFPDTPPDEAADLESMVASIRIG